MTAHELAKKLLAGPDVPVIVNHWWGFQIVCSKIKQEELLSVVPPMWVRDRVDFDMEVVNEGTQVVSLL